MRFTTTKSLLTLTVFLFGWLAYSLMIPVVLSLWQLTGDEPHYLLAAHSLVHDGDLNLKNNYLDHDYAAFYGAAYLDPHVKIVADSTWLLAHDIGLPVLLTPAYALGARLGVMYWMACLGALLGAQLFLLGWEVSGRWWAGVLGWLAIAFSPPLSLYVFQIYPEIAGGLLAVYLTRQVLGTPDWLSGSISAARWTAFRAPLVTGALMALPWLSGRYLPLALWFVGLLIWKNWPDRRLWVSCVAPALGSSAAYLVVNFWLFGGPTPSATPSGNAVVAGLAQVALPQIWRGLAAWPLDQQRGLLVYGPILIIALVGLPHLWRLRGVEGLAQWGPLALMWVLASVWGGFYVGWEISARFLIVGLPLTAGAIAAAVARIKSRLFWCIAAGLLALSLVNTALLLRRPFYAFHESPVKFYEDISGWTIRQFLPALGVRSAIVPANRARYWEADPGTPAYLTRATVNDLSMGWYVIRGQAALSSGAGTGSRPAIVFDVFSSESGLALAHSEVAAPQGNIVTDVNIPFYNPYYNKWDFPLYVDVQTTGAANVRLSYLLLEPDPGATYLRVLVWVTLITLVVVVFADARRISDRLSGLRPVSWG